MRPGDHHPSAQAEWDAYQVELGEEHAERQRAADEERAEYEAGRAEEIYTDEDRRLDWIDEMAGDHRGLELERAPSIP